MARQRRNRQQEKLRRMAAAIWRKEPQFKSLSDDELAEEGEKLRQLAGQSSSLDIFLSDAYALVSENAARILKMRPRRNQIEGAIALHRGMIIEMANGEGKTLTATLPAYLNSLAGHKTHIATYNEYLATRDAQWMGPLYMALGLSVSVIQEDAFAALKLEQQGTTFELVPCERKEAYQCDITYGRYQDFVFDYLRDNMVLSAEYIVQDRLDYIILDEVDSVLIDQARIPLTVSQERKGYPKFYSFIWKLALAFRPAEHYILQPLMLTQIGIQAIENELGIKHKLYSEENAGLARQIIQSLHAKHNYLRDRDYIVSDNHLFNIDVYTGRPLNSPFSDGLHQALQAKESLPITPETDRVAEISYQHFFKLYKKMAGMTATAEERKKEFRDVYNTSVVIIPPLHPSQRIDLIDLIYRTNHGRSQALVNEIKEIHATGRPILVDTLTPERATEISQVLKRANISCQVLDANHHAEEAQIIAAAGRKGAVTIAAKLAGRGTDIQVTDEALACKSVHWINNKRTEICGLHVIGVERNESRHIDRQLIGRAGRQNKPGSSQFCLALDDNLLQRFAAERVAKIMQMVGFDEDMPLSSGMVSRMLENAQNKIEEQNLTQRQRAYEFDGVLDKQRRRIYAIRRRAIMGEDLTEDINSMIENVVSRSINRYLPKNHPKRAWDISGIRDFFLERFPSFDPDTFNEFEDQRWNDIKERLLTEMRAIYNRRLKEAYESIPPELRQEGRMQDVQRYFLVEQLDKYWHTHLCKLNEVRQEMSLRTVVQKDQLGWYMMKSNELFWQMIENIEIGFLSNILSNWSFQRNTQVSKTQLPQSSTIHKEE